MTVNIENEYLCEISINYRSIIQEVVEAAVSYVNCPYEIEVNVLLTDNDSIQEINRENRGIDRPTDVLSFPNLEFSREGVFAVDENEEADYFDPDTGELLLGDIMISADKVMEQARSYGHSIRREFAFLVAHSMLHLCGYDHMEEAEGRVMEQKQEEILRRLDITRD